MHSTLKSNNQANVRFLYIKRASICADTYVSRVEVDFPCSRRNASISLSSCNSLRRCSTFFSSKAAASSASLTLYKANEGVRTPYKASLSIFLIPQQREAETFFTFLSSLSNSLPHTSLFAFDLTCQLFLERNDMSNSTSQSQH